MINKKYFCNICDKYVLNKSNHNKTKLHTQLSFSGINKYYHVDIPVIEIDNVLNKHICNYNKKFRNFDCWCIIQNDYFCEKNILIRKIVPDIVKIQAEKIRRNKCRLNDLVYMELVFITDLESATYNHYFQLPKPMIERKMCQTIDRNPKLIKILDHMPKPYKRHIIIKHWVIRGDDDTINGLVPANWMDLEANIIT